MALMNVLGKIAENRQGFISLACTGATLTGTEISEDAVVIARR
jgi:hypothetical protein